MRYYLFIMARIKPLALQGPLKVASVKLPPMAGQILQTLSQDASDALGWTVTSSAVVRALIQYAERQPPEWAASKLHPIIEEEIAQGRVWGKQSKKNKV